MMQAARINDSLVSIGNRKWLANNYCQRSAFAIQQKFLLPEIVARVLSARGFLLEDDNFDKIISFLKPTLKDNLQDPSHLKDMDKVVSRLIKAILEDEKIVVFGDYDVDGATSSALFFRFFKAIGKKIEVYIPDRITEGYGPNIDAMLKLKKQGADLIITVDCGTVSYEPIETATKIGLEVIVIDHHLGADKLPNALGVVNPNRLDEKSEYTYLAAVGVSFLLLIALNRALREQGFYKEIEEPNLLNFLDLVALGTVCDVMPLIGLNRVFVTQGLKLIRANNNLGIATLLDIANLHEPTSSYHLGFVIGPRINAGGRVGKSFLGSKLLSSDNKQEVLEIGVELESYNQERKQIEQQVLDEAIHQVEEGNSNTPIIVAFGENWHPGVIGIVASRLKDIYNKPSVVIAFDGNEGKASARSINGIDIGAMIVNACTKNILEKGGGHNAAGGFTVLKEKLDSLVQFFAEKIQTKYPAEIFDKVSYYDAVISLNAVNIDFIEKLEILAPFGTGNREPKFLIENVLVSKTKVVAEKHLMCFLSDRKKEAHKEFSNNSYIKSIAFKVVGERIGDFLQTTKLNPISLIGKVSINHWQGKKNPQIIIEDVIG